LDNLLWAGGRSRKHSDFDCEQVKPQTCQTQTQTCLLIKVTP